MYSKCSPLETMQWHTFSKLRKYFENTSQEIDDTCLHNNNNKNHVERDNRFFRGTFLNFK